MRALLLLFFAFLASSNAARAGGIVWHPWSDTVFQQAHREHKFVLLDLEAVWCHWCHVMDETTYRDPSVVALVESHYIAVKVDQDSRPDISNRYEDYGWPATVVFGPDGGEIVKRQGYFKPAEMASILRAIVKDPSPGPSVEPEKELKFGAASRLAPALRDDLQRRFEDSYDSKHGGWGTGQKFLDWNCVEYAMLRSQSGDHKAELMARETLAQQRKLIDPVWGGVYQYSVGGDWDQPHFEKIMAFQANDLRIYALAYQQWKDPADLQSAREIARYLRDFLTSPEGSFYTSQDADLIDGKHSADYFKLDDAARRSKGIPRIDRHRYARENGWAIAALATLYQVTKDQADLDAAVRAANWVVANRAIPGGGFRHDVKDEAGPYLDDTLAMGRAFLTLYDGTGEIAWLQAAEAAAEYCRANFPGEAAGFVTAKPAEGLRYPPAPERDENINMARFASALFRVTKNERYQQMGEQAMRYLVEPSIARQAPTAGVLLAAREMDGQ
ncbi:MAG: DUF255 domain-containing protein [Bryobacteraceae bacterium]|jgi:uncharacterized protein YyaL (SSP411 family)